MRAHWRQGMGQIILHLFQCNLFCGTRLGVFVLRTYYSRLYVNEQVVAIEVPLQVIQDLANDPSAQSLTITIQELFEASDILATTMPHQWIGLDGTYSYGSLGRLRDSLALSVYQLAGCPISTLGDRLPPDLAPLALPAQVSSPVPLSDEALLELAFLAHPDKYPRWWVDAKKRLVAAGTPEALVAASAKPRSKSSHSSAGDGSRAAGRSRGSSAGGRGSSTAHSGSQAPRQSDGRAPHLGHRELCSSAPADTEGASGHPTAAPVVDDDDFGFQHTQRWLSQQQTVPSTPPRHGEPGSASATTLTSHGAQESNMHGYSGPPTPEETPKRMLLDALREALYEPAEIQRSSPVLLHGELDQLEDGMCSEEAERERQESFERNVARFTLAGWRVCLVTPEVMTATLGC